MARPTGILCLLLVIVIHFSLLVPCSESASISVRMPRGISGALKRIFGRRKEQGYAQYQGGPYSAYGNYGQSSYAYPQYASQYPSSGSYGSYASQSSYPSSYGASSGAQASPGYGYNYGTQQGSYPGYGSAAPASGQQYAASSNYASYQAAPGSQAAASTGSHQGTYSYPQSAYASPSSSSSSGSGGNLDLHQVLDALVRSAGLAPVGDQEAAASTITAKGDTPVFSFKKLYSFPFYLSSDDKVKDSYQLHIPFMKKHIRRRMGMGRSSSNEMMAAEPKQQPK